MSTPATAPATPAPTAPTVAAAAPATTPPAVVSGTPAPSAQAVADQEARDRDARTAEQQSQNSGGDLMGQFIMMLLKALFGSFTDTNSEYSEIDRENAAPSTAPRGAGAGAALLNSEVRGKLQALAAKYPTMPADISPFTVNATITSGLGARSINVPGASHDHQGIDIVPGSTSAEAITIHNTMPGIVVRSETQRNSKGEVAGFGNWVEVACIDGTRRRYGHLKEPGVAVGSVLDQGATIGIMGNTGTSGGAHLHYEWRDADGTTIPPKIGETTYARNDRSYIRSTVLASNVTASPAAAPVQVAANTPAPAPKAAAHPQHPAATPSISQQVADLGLAAKMHVSDAVQGAQTAMSNARTAIGSYLSGPAQRG